MQTTRSCGEDKLRHEIRHLDESALVLGSWFLSLAISLMNGYVGDVMARVLKTARIYVHVFLFVNYDLISLLITLYLVAFGDVT